MFPHKKIKPGTKKEEEKPIDVAWILFIGVAKFNYHEKEIYLMQIGKWMELFEIYKSIHNFETMKNLYETDAPEEKKASVFDL